MDRVQGTFDDWAEAGEYDPSEDDIGREAPPVAIGLDERRMQVRAYNHWASLLGDRTFPLIADLETGSMPDFDPFAVLLDFAGGVENPAVRYIGSALAAESDCDPTQVQVLSDVPGRSLLSRITDHYMQIIANQAPIGFEAEFVNQRGRTVLYRGILLPFSGSLASETIDLIYGVINWKELADQQTTDALMQEVEQALHPRAPRGRQPLTAWADGPADFVPAPDGAMEVGVPEDVLDLTMLAPEDGGLVFTDGPDSLADILASARELAEAAQGAEDRSRSALYAAIGRAYDFALAAADQPEDLRELVLDAGLTMQERAPLIPVVKLVFGATYDKTRLTEYATALGHAQRLGLTAGSLGGYLAAAQGGLKGVVQQERNLRREDSGADAKRVSPHEAALRRLRALPTRALNEIATDGEEFTLVIARRMPGGEIVLVGEVTGEDALLERAARKLSF